MEQQNSVHTDWGDEINILKEDWWMRGGEMLRAASELCKAGDEDQQGEIWLAY